jgi:short-subunit dehydrogenase
MKINNKWVWITGASSGIGEALVYAIARQKNKLIISSRKTDALEIIKQKALQLGATQVEIVAMDLANTQSIEKAFTMATKITQNQIDVLFNNGGISQRSKTLETKIEVDRMLMEVDYFGTITLSKLVLPSMIERKSGIIAVTSSLVGKFGSPYRSSYAAAKHALHGFFDSLRAEIYQSGVLISLICPGFIKTEISINALVGDGSTLGTMDNAQNKGMLPSECAKQMIEGLEAGKIEFLVGGKETFAVYFKRFFPNLWAKMLPKLAVR